MKRTRATGQRNTARGCTRWGKHGARESHCIIVAFGQGSRCVAGWVFGLPFPCGTCLSFFFFHFPVFFTTTRSREYNQGIVRCEIVWSRSRACAAQGTGVSGLRRGGSAAEKGETAVAKARVRRKNEQS
jgi:hypothetical protein